MTESHAVPPAPRAPTVLGPRVVDTDPATTELRRVLLRHLALDVHPNQLAGVVVRLCAAIRPMLAAPPVKVGVRAELTDRELQVLVRMAMGASNARIGRELHLSEDTVKTYARRLYATLDVRDRAHAVARGFQRGILVVGAEDKRQGLPRDGVTDPDDPVGRAGPPALSAVRSGPFRAGGSPP